MKKLLCSSIIGLSLFSGGHSFAHCNAQSAIQLFEEAQIIAVEGDIPDNVTENSHAILLKHELKKQLKDLQDKHYEKKETQALRWSKQGGFFDMTSYLVTTFYSTKGRNSSGTVVAGVVDCLNPEVGGILSKVLSRDEVQGIAQRVE